MICLETYLGKCNIYVPVVSLTIAPMWSAIVNANAAIIRKNFHGLSRVKPDMTQKCCTHFHSNLQTTKQVLLLIQTYKL